jgi:hypothetical protein
VLTRPHRGHGDIRQLVAMCVTAMVWLRVFRGRPSAHYLHNRSG